MSDETDSVVEKSTSYDKSQIIPMIIIIVVSMIVYISLWVDVDKYSDDAEYDKLVALSVISFFLFFFNICIISLMGAKPNWNFGLMFCSGLLITVSYILDLIVIGIMREKGKINVFNNYSGPIIVKSIFLAIFFGISGSSYSKYKIEWDNYLTERASTKETKNIAMEIFTNPDERARFINYLENKPPPPRGPPPPARFGQPPSFSGRVPP
jgi:hypothetical protein